MKGIMNMKQVVLFIIVMLFSVKSHAVCPLPPSYHPKPRCQIAEGVFKNGEVSYKQSYCKGDFPYCETWSGDCCSEPSYVTDGGGLCCNPSEYVGHKVASISPGGTMLSVSAYKCCSIAEYGKNSTYYFDKEEHVHCCGGKVYQAKNGSDEKSCCNPEFDSEGNITHYHTVVSVEGAPEGETNKICCKAIGEAPGVYRATAYWNGSSAQCCAGTVYKTGKDESGTETYGCCQGTKAPKEERTHGVVSVLGAQNGEEGCCPYYEEEGKKKLGTAYWNGSSVQCCNGTPRKSGVDKNGKPVYTCCEGKKTHKVTSVLDAPNGEEACCSVASYGENPTAYWNGSGPTCCKGDAKKKIDNSGYVCCPVETCSDGQEPVDNYVDGIGVCGKVCCEVKADEEGYYDDGYYSGPWKRTYGVSGAIDGKCCGGETSYTVSRERWWGGGDCLETVESSNAYSYTVLDNNGYYCAKSEDIFYENSGDERCAEMFGWRTTVSYPNPSTCITVSESWGAGEDFHETCRYSNSGDPRNGSPCN